MAKEFLEDYADYYDRDLIIERDELEAFDEIFFALSRQAELVKQWEIMKLHYDLMQSLHGGLVWDCQRYLRERAKYISWTLRALGLEAPEFMEIAEIENEDKAGAKKIRKAAAMLDPLEFVKSEYAAANGRMVYFVTMAKQRHFAGLVKRKNVSNYNKIAYALKLEIGSFDNLIKTATASNKQFLK
jgi:hypothetical protein